MNDSRFPVFRKHKDRVSSSSLLPLMEERRVFKPPLTSRSASGQGGSSPKVSFHNPSLLPTQHFTSDERGEGELIPILRWHSVFSTTETFFETVFISTDHLETDQSTSTSNPSFDFLLLLIVVVLFDSSLVGRIVSDQSFVPLFIFPSLPRV